MEFVDGAALHGPMGLDDALAVAMQIAEALRAAHVYDTGSRGRPYRASY